MTRRRFVVNVGLVLVLSLIGFFCYRSGKAYDLILENTPYTLEGKNYPAVEALQLTIDDQTKPVYLLEGDRQTGTAIGLHHQMKIEILDENDKVIETKVVPFSVNTLGGDRILNIARMYATGK